MTREQIRQARRDTLREILLKEGFTPTQWLQTLERSYDSKPEAKTTVALCYLECAEVVGALS